MALGHNTVRNRHPAGAADALESSCEPDVIIESFLPPESALKKEAESLVPRRLVAPQTTCNLCLRGQRSEASASEV